MSGLDWPLLALLFSGCGAVIIGYNQWARLDGHALVVLRVLGIWPLALAAAWVWPFPTQPLFYGVAALMGLGLAYADIVLFNAARDHSGRLAALYVPLKMLLAFVLWAAFEPASLMPLWAAPWKMVLLAVGFGCCAGALVFIRRCDVSWPALVAIVPVAVLFALGDIVAKTALDPAAAMDDTATVLGRAVAFLTMTSTVGAGVGLVMGGAFRPTWAMVGKSALFGVILLSSLTLLLLALARAPNPGYVAAITMLSGVWLALWARVVRGEQNNVVASLVLLAGAMAVGVAGH